jgi:hypothetical protein
MTFWNTFAEQTPTLALVSLGASETLIGMQSGLRLLFGGLQLPALRLISWFPKRSLLIWGNLVALAAAFPLVFFGWLSGLEHDLAVSIVFAALALIAFGINLGDLVWFPLLRGFVEPDRIGRFFALLRSAWQAALILFLVGAHLWLQRHENGFGGVFGVAWVLGLVRLALIWRIPERSETGGERLRARDALALIWNDVGLRRYSISMTWAFSVRSAAIPFALVMLRRALGFTNASAIETTIATFAGGVVSLTLWGAVTDRLGSYAVLRTAALGVGALYLGLAFIRPMGDATRWVAIGFFFAHSILMAGYAVADTRLLFHLTPPDAPSKALVGTAAVEGVVCGLAPWLAGAVLDPLLARASDPLAVYHGFFAVIAVLASLSFLPLRGLART